MMKKIYNLLLILLINLIFLSSANSATYYVNSLTGNNSNSPASARNIDTPWLTVQFAINNAAVTDGDNIVVATGTYAGFNLTKRLNVIGAWKGSNASVNTVFNSIVTLSASGGSPTQRMVLKNLRVDVNTGDALDMRQSYVTLENVYATATTSLGIAGLRINSANLTDLLVESCNFNFCTYAGIFFPTFSGLNGFVMKNSTVSDNIYFGMVAFQNNNNPTMIENVDISHCAFMNNNPANQTQGHTIYMEKLSNSVFQNISVVMPVNNNRIGININLLSRLDYSNIEIRNSKVSRSSPGSGIWIQARNDLFNSPAALDNVVLRGLAFDQCDTNVAFNRQVTNMVVDKCDMSTYLRYGVVNYTDQGGTVIASNNKWQNGATPDTTVISGGLMQNGSNILSLMPSTQGIFIGMGIVGPGIPANTYVVGKTNFTIIMSNNGTLDGFIANIGFAFNFATSTDLVRTALNFFNYTNPMPNSIVNNSNVSFPTLAAAISGTNAGGTIYNVPSGLISGTTTIDKDLTLVSPGSGFFHSGSLTTFENLTVSNASWTLGSDFAISDNLTPNRVVIGTDNTLIVNGAIVPGGMIEGGSNSDMLFGGSSANTGLTTVQNGLRTLQLNRANGITLQNDLTLSRLLFIQNGLVTLGTNNLTIGHNAFIFNPFNTNYVNTNSTGELRKRFDLTTPTAFNFTVGNGGFSPNQVCFLSWTLAPGSYLASRTVNAKHPQNNCISDYLNRYWVVLPSGISNFTTNNRFNYQNSDVVGTEASIYGAELTGISWTTFTPVNAAGDFFIANNISQYGDFTGGGMNCINDFDTKINAKLFLQGAYITSSNSMRTDLLTEGIIPLTQPYANSQYNYNGTESVSSIPAGVVDWVYLEVRTTSNEVTTMNEKRAAFIKSDGNIVDLDGVSPVKVSVISGDYFIVVGHRNHLPVMSNQKQTLTPTSSQFDFTSGTNQYFGNQAADLNAGLVFGAYSGDANESFIISAADYGVVTANLGSITYNQGDLNLSAIVSSADYNFVTINLGRVSQVPNY